MSGDLAVPHAVRLGPAGEAGRAADVLELTGHRSPTAEDAEAGGVGGGPGGHPFCGPQAIPEPPTVRGAER